MMQRILVPLDGSASSERVLPVAAQMARNTQSILILVRVVSTSTLFPAQYRTPLLESRAVVQSQVDAAYTYLKRIASSPILQRIPLEIIVWQGVPDEGILDVATQRDCDMILMTSTGQSGTARISMETVAGRVVYDAPMPVLVLRGAPSFATFGQEPRTLQVVVELTDSALFADEGLQNIIATCLLANPNVAEVRLTFLLSPSLTERGAVSQGDLTPRLNGLIADLEQACTDRMQDQRPLFLSWSLQSVDNIADMVFTMAQSQQDARASSLVTSCDLVMISDASYARLWRQVTERATERATPFTCMPILVIPVNKESAPLSVENTAGDRFAH